ncbi:MAG: beta-lactamase family protein [Thermoplasmata archaeon]|nr:MAG: beta-lactamase family protein [Thermoplasmata archaeon]
MKFTKSRFMLVLVLSAALFLVTFLQSNTYHLNKSPSDKINSHRLKSLTDKVEEWFENKDIVGAVLMVIKDRKTILHQAIGWRDREREKLMELDTICRMRSMTKPFVGTSILMLAEQKKLSLSDNVSKYIAYYDNEKCREITVEQLITHTGGFEQPGYPKNPAAYKDLEDLVKTIGEVGPTMKPGRQYSYSDAGSSTLAHLISVISKKPAEDYIQENIFDKLGMKDTSCNSFRDDPRRPRVSCTYRLMSGVFLKYWDNSMKQAAPYFRGSGGIYSTTEDYAKFLAMWMDEGMAGSARFLKPETVQKALTRSSYTSEGKDGYGYHWEIYNAELEAFGHRGSDGTLAIAVPRDDLMLLYFTQSRGNKTTRQMVSLFFDVFYPDN